MTSVKLRTRSWGIDSLADATELHPVFRRVLSSRGVSTIEENQTGLNHLLPLDSIRNLKQAADLLSRLIQQERSILVFGDYDADGATSTALSVKALRLMGHEAVNFLMPDRFIDGYGLSVSVASRILKSRPNCVITVDNGVASFEGIDLLRQNDIDVIVTDHHLAAESLPNASVMVNQNAWPNEIEGKNLAGVGVAFYLMLAVRSRLRELAWFDGDRSEPNLANCLDLVAIGTIADLVPLDFQNRLLITEGLKRIRAGVCSAGIKSLVNISGCHFDNFSTSNIGFALAPRINAAGRLDDMTIGVQCLMSEDIDEAHDLAKSLDDINQHRKDIQQQMASEALTELDKLDESQLSAKQCIVSYQPDWHEGIVGIVASQLKEKYHRPAIVFAQSENGQIKGSGRSISGVHLRDILDAVNKNTPGLIQKFGGHAMAAGLTLNGDSVDEFRSSFEQVIQELVDPACFSTDVECDGGLAAIDFNLDFAKSLSALAPWGQGFPTPSFVGEFEVVSKRVLSNKYLKLVLAIPNHCEVIDAIAFFQPEIGLDKELERIKIHYELSVNRFRDIDSIQLLIRDIL